MTDVLFLAILKAKADGDDRSAAALRALASDPEAFAAADQPRETSAHDGKRPGEFAPKGGGGDSGKADKKSPKAEPKPAESHPGNPAEPTDDDIVRSNISRHSVDADDIGEYSTYDDDGREYKSVVRLVEHEYEHDPNPDDPDAELETYPIYRWEADDAASGDRIEAGDWTFDRESAEDAGRRYARQNHEEPPEEDEEEGEEEDDDGPDVAIPDVPPPKKRPVQLGATKQPKSYAEVSVHKSLSDAEDKLADRIMGAVFGDDAYEALQDTLGMPDDAEIVTMRAGRYKPLFSDDPPLDAVGVRFEVRHPKMGRVSRFVGIDSDGRRFVRNEILEIKPAYQGEGMGADIFARQAEWAAEYGIDYIQTHAAGGPGQEMNGYYTWPRFGYDQSLTDAKGIHESDESTYKKARERFPEAETILDVMSTPEGREWWKTNGTDLYNARFDLSEGSRSLGVLSAYLGERDRKRKPAATKST